MRNWQSLLLVPALICALAGEGRGQEREVWKESTWYGGQILVADGVSLLTLLGGAGRENLPVVIVGAAGYVIAPAVIHVVHDNNGRAVLSALMRVGLPVGAAFLAYGLAKSQSSGDDSEYNGMGWALSGLVGFALGMAAATTVDVCIARTPRVFFPESPPPTPRKLVSLTTAGLLPTANGAQLVLGGSF